METAIMSHIRTAIPSDFPAIKRLANQLATHTHDPSPTFDLRHLDEFFFGDDAPMHVAVAERDSCVEGLIAWMLHFDLYSGCRRVFISDLCVDAERRGHQSGAALFGHVVHWARQNRATKITWEVWRLNHTAQAFYARQGAVPDTDIINYCLLLHDKA